MSISRRRESGKFSPEGKGAARKRGAPKRKPSERFFRARSSALLLALALFQLRPEGVNVILADDLGRDDHQAVGGNPRLVALEVFGHRFHALIAPLIGLLDDS